MELDKVLGYYGYLLGVIRPNPGTFGPTLGHIRAPPPPLKVVEFRYLELWLPHTRYTVHGRVAKSPLVSEYRLKTRSKKFKLFFKKVSKNGPKSGSKPVRFPTVIHKVACFWTVFSKTFICGLSNLHCSVPCVTRTYPQYINSRKSVTDKQTHKQTHKLTGHPVFDSPTNVRTKGASRNN